MYSVIDIPRKHDSARFDRKGQRTVRETSLKIIEGQDTDTSRFALQTALSNFQKKTDMR